MELHREKCRKKNNAKITLKSLEILSSSTYNNIFGSCSPPMAEYALLPYDILGQGGLFYTGLKGSSTQAGTGSTNVQLISSYVADCQALT